MEGAHRYNQWIYDRVRDGLGQRVLEIGCGTGTITSFLVDRQLVVGIDVVDRYIRSTAERYGDRPNIVIRRHDLTESIEPLRGYNFDSAVSVNVFEHIANDEAAIKAVYTLLEPGGRFTVLVPCHPALLGQRKLRGAAVFDQLVPALAVLDRVELPLGLSLIATARKPAG